MLTVISVRFRYNPKPYWYKFSSDTPKEGDYVLVNKDGGLVVGLVLKDPFEISEEELGDKGPLKSVARIANEEDLDELDKLDERGAEAKKVFRELAKKHELDIKPIDVEYIMGANRAIFHFSSEERVDFRDLVKDLASTLHVHVDMRQIGVRDEAKLAGGLGHCGEMLCCSRFSSEFMPVSIRMAKEQDLPLNPSKVSGSCGRLMCCLRYEFETYKEFKARAPKINSTIETPVGSARVIELDVPRELVKIKMEETEDAFYVPLSDMQADENSESVRPCRVCERVFNECCPMSLKTEKGLFVSDDFGDSENSAQDQSSNKTEAKAKKSSEKRSGETRSKSRRKHKAKSADNKNRSDENKNTSTQKTRTHVSSSSKQANKKQGSTKQATSKQTAARQDGAEQGSAKQGSVKPRPGQKSSAIQNPQKNAGKQSGGKTFSNNNNHSNLTSVKDARKPSSKRNKQKSKGSGKNKNRK